VRIRLEWLQGDAWYSAMAVSRNSNHTFKHEGKVYVFKEKREGEQVLVLDSGKWVNAGSVTRNGIFLGSGQSSGEYYQTPEGLRSARESLQSFLASRRALKRPKQELEVPLLD